jgi:hypothetical protein
LQRVCMKVVEGWNSRANADLSGHWPADFLHSAG